MSTLRSLEQKCFLPDGTEFKTWEPLEHKFSRTYFVDQNHAGASDANPGTRELPFRTIGQAARILQPGERVVVESGVYREWVCPARGGTDPEHMISYEAAPGAQVVIKGSEILKAKWEKSRPWPMPAETADGTKPRRVWMVRLPGELFMGYNPFGMINYPQIDEVGYWDLKFMFSKPCVNIFLQVRGLIFQNGRCLRQVSRFDQLASTEGAFWAESHGLIIHITPFGDIDPNDAEWELTTREQCFSPEEYSLNYIRVKGFTMEQAGNGFPFPQRSALSVMHGTHWIIEENTIRWVNSVGMDLGRGGNVHDQPYGHQIVRHNSICDCGICGIAGVPLQDTLIEDNFFRNNAWLDTELMAECAAIKTHWNENVLIRRNLIIETTHGTGIYLDCYNKNCRITQNAVIFSGSCNTMAAGPGQGAIYLEAASGPALVDNNFVWGSTKTNGIYGYCSGDTIYAFNLIGRCLGGGITLVDEPGRPEGNPAGGNRVLNNILADNGWNIDFLQSSNSSDFNLFGATCGIEPALEVWAKDADVMGTLKNWRLKSGMSYYDWRKDVGEFNLWEKNLRLNLEEWRKELAQDMHSVRSDIKMDFDPETLELTWSNQGPVPECPPVEGISEDFQGRVRAAGVASPGPFGDIPANPQTISVDPRH
jgi:hypothetical protein